VTYKETIEFLYSQLPVYHRIGKAAYKANLDNTVALDNYFNHPHLRYRTIHIAGTNGKGSVSHILASILQEAGYKTALYTSPHLKDYRERIRINGEMIAEEEVISFVENNIRIITELKPSFFELSVALAFRHFALQQVDIAVVETGLGGRLDSTNIITPVLSVITNIGFDHMDLLGDTIPAIAGEKAGIIKNNVPVVIGETSELTRDLFLEKSGETGSEIVFADKIYKCSLKDFDSADDMREFELSGIEGGIKIKGYSGLAGDYQERNIQTVAASVDFLKRYFDISVNNLTAGIEKVIQNTGLLGRWQVIGREPLVVCDTGHNADGLRYVISQIAKVSKKRLHIVIGFVIDKDLSMVLPLLPENAEYYFTRASVQRALDPLVLKEKASDYRLSGEAYNTVHEAIEGARSNASKEDMIFIGGSTFIVAEAL
jgi:dihydrofolate synthase/folylpolyglutamate synthase